MKRIGITLSILVLAGSLASAAWAAEDDILMKEQASNNNYCHMKFPAMRQSTLASNNPQLKDSSTGDVVDFYGSCDESPTGADQVTAQKQAAERNDYSIKH